jgi:hypothetical protein
MELNNNINKKRSIRSITNNTINHKLFRIEKSNSNSDFSSVSKKTGAFEERNFFSGKGKMFSSKINQNNLSFSIQNNVEIRSSLDLSIKDIKAIKEKKGFICTNINISIDNPNFSIQNIENNKSFSINGTNLTNKINNNLNSNSNINNRSLISFKGSNIDSEIKNDDNRKIISSIYADYLENKSNSEVISNNNCKNDPKINKFNEFINKNKILKYEFTKGYISGFSAYTYQNEENIHKSKLSININVDKVSAESDNNLDNKFKLKNHLINFFSLFCGDRKDDDDSLTKFLKNNFKDILLEDKEIISNTANAIKNSFIKCEIKYINYFLKGIQKDLINSELDLCNKISRIQSCSIIIILVIDDIIYISNIGKLNSFISSNLSRRIEYLSKDDNCQEKFQKHIDKKRKSLNSLLNSNNNYFNELNNSKSNLNNENSNVLKKINYKYEFIRVFPGRKLYDILLNYNNNKNASLNKSLTIKRNSNESKKHPNKNVKINNFIKENQKKTDKNILYRRASLGPFFKISSKNVNYNPKTNYTQSCAMVDSDNKCQIIKVLSSYPDILSFNYKNNKHDFIFVGCKIIFETLTYDKICKSVYETMKKCIKKHRSFELFLGCVIKDIIKMCITAGIKSSISCLFLCFNSIKQLYLKQDIEQIKNVIVPLCLTYSNHEKYEIYDDLLIHDFIDIDKSNNYYDIIDENINNIIKTKGNLFDINNLNNIKIESSKKINENDGKIKNSKKSTKKCCCFC